MSRRSALVALLIVALGALAFALWQGHLQPSLPDGISKTNGRVEATRIEIATKLAGELLDVHVREGDMVRAGQVLAVVETEEIEAGRASALADLRRQEHRKREAEAEAERLGGEIAFAQSERDRARSLYDKGYLAKDKLESRETTLITARAAHRAAQAVIESSQAQIEMAQAEIRRLDSLLAHGELKAPRDARVQYRLAEPGEIMAAGARVLTLIDLGDVYMSVFLPAADAGRLAIGAEARIVFDAAPEWVFPAEVTFVAPDAQFTPKSVETQSEREKLMFRVKLSVARDIALRFQDRVKPGLRGTAYVATRRDVTWPEWLSIRIPQ